MRKKCYEIFHLIIFIIILVGSFSCTKKMETVPIFSSWNSVGENDRIVDSLLTVPNFSNQQIDFAINLLMHGTSSKVYSKLRKLFGISQYKKYSYKLWYALSKNDTLLKFIDMKNGLKNASLDDKISIIRGWGETEIDTLDFSNYLIDELTECTNDTLSKNIFIALGKLNNLKLNSMILNKLVNENNKFNDKWYFAWFLWKQYRKEWDSTILNLLKTTKDDYAKIFLIKALTKSNLDYAKEISQFLKSDNWKLVVESLNYFKIHKDFRLVDDFIKLASMKKFVIRITAIEVLGFYDTENSVKMLKFLSKDVNNYVKYVALQGLIKLNNDEVDFLHIYKENEYYKIRNLILDYWLHNKDKNIIDFLIKEFPKANVKVKPWILNNLYGLDSLRTIPLAKDALEDNDFLTQVIALDIVVGTTLLTHEEKVKLLEKFVPVNSDVAREVARILPILFPNREVYPFPEPVMSFELPIRYNRAIIYTTKGNIEILFYKDAYNAVKNFQHLVELKYYDGLYFHRIVPNWVSQGGDPHGDGYGGPGYSLKTAVTLHEFDEYSIGFANAGFDTDGSQFFITHLPAPRLNGKYAVFGKVIAGKGVVDNLTPIDKILNIRLLQ